VVFGAAVQAGYWWVVVVGVIASAIAAFFYLKVIVAMFMQEREGEPAELGRGPLGLGVIGLAAAATIFFGLLWTPLIEAASDATFFAGG
jgi:NADH-quinone oxidoreductase subunit N